MSAATTPPPRVTLTTLAERRAAGDPIVMVTAYDCPSAQIASDAKVDAVLVGDSAANVVLGYESTVPITVEEMLVLSSAVRRGLTTPLLVVDLPFGSYEASDEQAVTTAQRLVKTGGAEVVKLEGGGTSADRAAAIVAAGIPVMGHVGLTPQTATALGGYRAQGRDAATAARVRSDALRLQAAGCFAIVFEAVPAALVERIMRELDILVIGIGAGAATHGQVLVLHDLLGITRGHTAKFVRRFAEVGDEMQRGVTAYTEAVRSRAFPLTEHTYEIAPEVLKDLDNQAGERD